MAACARVSAPHRAQAPDAAVAVEALQLFGAAPELMPRLGFEPSPGLLTISASKPVFVTVVEVDPATQVRRVVFPEPGAAPLRVSGEMSLQLSLAHGADPLPTHGLLVIASENSLVVKGDSSGIVTTGRAPASRQSASATSTWRIPDEMPEQWAAVYIWVPQRGRAAAGGR